MNKIYHKCYNKIYYNKHKDRLLKRNKEYRLKNKDIINKKYKKYRLMDKYKLYQKQWRLKNKSKMKNYNENFKKNNKDYHKNYKKIYYSKPKNKISHNMSNLVNQSLSGKKNGQHWENIVGYSFNDLKQHLEKQFTKRMNWANYGKYWVVDHRIPQSKFEFVSYNDKQFKDCWALDNLQPKEKISNLIKHNSYSEPTLNVYI